MNYGFIYCIGNEYMPGIYKIGMTERSPMQRCCELSSSTSAPYPFDILFYVEVENPRQVERELHEAYYPARVSENREFFKMDPRLILNGFEQYAEYITMTNHGRGVLACLDFDDEIAKCDDLKEAL
ncbi:GIY-YIG nuclease family protein [Azotobacter chroococcum]|uniref:T5orf172 domain-containing protein n=1 Tax=Azotobacter chroococcum TaxID=353 RepID=A0A4R1P8U1_9GAMM|nr:GIY-YIG nuclease family protein [Azotobacter chroococcum]TBV95283.1 GIY-YIG nuclease family protein [Azotobacter chroococcum]TCL22090.1 T5orf172 domain-containing protein [Azotobacter chroococcum]